MADKVAYEFDPFKKFGVKLSRRDTSEARDKIIEFVKTEVLSAIGEGKSPVKGGAWARSLTKSYKTAKSKLSSSVFANLELTGELLDAIEVAQLSSTRLSLEVSGDQAGKADGNNRGTYGHGSPLKGGKYKREFIPKRGQTFSDKIWRGVKQILDEYEE